MIVVGRLAGGSAGGLKLAVIWGAPSGSAGGEQAIGLLAAEHEVDGAVEARAIRAFVGQVPLGNVSHHGQAGGGGLGGVGSAERAVGSLLAREPLQGALDG